MLAKRSSSKSLQRAKANLRLLPLLLLAALSPPHLSPRPRGCGGCWEALLQVLQLPGGQVEDVLGRWAPVGAPAAGRSGGGCGDSSTASQSMCSVQVGGGHLEEHSASGFLG